MPSERPSVAEAEKLRDHIIFYGAFLNQHDYRVLKLFGMWFAENTGAGGEVILSDWTPKKRRPNYKGDET